ncbi:MULTISPECIES: YibE/F family protein [Clostridium]|uniref:YibE/F family protein n=2 Tax=Clostridium TaxID=1485 RepID=A0A173ZSZ7_9CLOT|nr:MULTISPECIES: YibE/F family protein [Clostridium]MDU7452807.1 YibE/F family protein [Clostridium saudiense]CUN78546.1 YibE/F family protein [Clostridium disporicum]SCJ71730.1 YibE/F-like protein [uncultured Clostridium sp.]
MEMIKRYIKNNKGRFFTVLIFFIVFLVLFIWTNNNYNIYKSTIAKVISLENVYDKTEKGTNDIEEKYYIQTMVVKVKNGQYKGQQITLKNSYSSSMLMNEKYKKGDDLFISINENSSELSGSIIGLKRDKFIVLLIGFFVIALVAVAGRFGIFTLCTLIANIVAFIYFIKLYVSGKDFMLINVLMIIFFSVVTLLILGGFSRKNIGAILSTLITTFLIFALYKISLAYTGDLHYELMDYIAGPNDLENIFLSGVLVGCLGAVMDVSITVNSAVNELVNAAKSITLKQLIKSIREIGHDIMGTMINVLMFSYIGGSLSIVILKIINGYNFQRLIQFDISFEIIRFLVGSIGIVSAVPISACVALLFFRKGMSKNDSVANNSIADVNDSSRRR